MVIIFLLIILTMFFVAFHNEIGSSLPQGLKPVFVIIIFLLIVACPCLMLRSVIIPNATQVGSFNNNHEEKSIYQENDTKNGLWFGLTSLILEILFIRKNKKIYKEE